MCQFVFFKNRIIERLLSQQCHLTLIAYWWYVFVFQRPSQSLCRSKPGEFYILHVAPVHPAVYNEYLAVFAQDLVCSLFLGLSLPLCPMPAQKALPMHAVKGFLKIDKVDIDFSLPFVASL